MRGVDHHHIDLGVDQRFRAFEALVAHGGRGSDAQAPGGVLGGIGIGDRLLDILDRDQPDAAPRIIDHQQLFDPPLMEQPPRLFLPGAERHGGEVLGRHQFADGLARVLGKADVAIGQYPDQLAVAIGHRDAADAVDGHDVLRLAQRGFGVDGDRIDHHATFIALDRAHCGDLFVDFEIAVQHADPAQLRHGDRHVGFGYRVHRAGHHRDAEADVARQPTGGPRHRRQDIALGRTQENVVESEAEGNVEMCHVENRLPGEKCGGPCNDGW